MKTTGTSRNLCRWTLLVMLGLAVFALAAMSSCTSVKRLVVTEDNKQKVAERVGSSSLPSEDKLVFATALVRAEMSKSFNLAPENAYTISGKSVGQIIREQKEYAALLEAQELARQQAEAEARAAFEQALQEARSMVSVTLLNKKNYDANIWAGNYSPYVNLAFEIENLSEKPIRGVKGMCKFLDIFKTPIKQIGLSYDDETIPPGEKRVYYGSFEINEFIDEDKAFWSKDLEDVVFEFEPSHIIFDDGGEVIVERPYDISSL